MIVRLMLLLVVQVVSTTVLNKESPEAGPLIEGDMALDPDQISALEEQLQNPNNAFAAIRTNLWITGGKNDVIKYVIDAALSGSSDIVKEAINEYEKYTCLRFQQVESRPRSPHLFFTTGAGCSSPVGRKFLGNSIQLAQGCLVKGVIMHEIGHSIGFFHEQSRADRDKYIRIMWNNIQDNQKFNFQKYRTDKIDSRGTEYDIDSLMHYGGRFFSKNGWLTIKTRNPDNQDRIGNRKGFSIIDVKQINRMYKCESHFPCEDTGKRCDIMKDFCHHEFQYAFETCRKTCGFC